MPDFNKVFLMGHLTRDPEIRHTQSGTAICSFGMAINRKWKGKDDRDGEEVCFVDLTAWGKTGEVINEYCHKGSPLFVEGRLKLDQWEDKQSGQKRSKLGVTLESFQFLGSKGEGAAGSGQSSPRSGSPPAAAPAKPADPPAGDDFDIEDDKIPF